MHQKTIIAWVIPGEVDAATQPKNVRGEPGFQSPGTTVDLSIPLSCAQDDRFDGSTRQRFSFSLSNALQSDFRFASWSSVLICLALQTRSPSLLQCGCAGKFSKRSSRMKGVRSTVSGPCNSVWTAKAGTRISCTKFCRQETQRSSTGCDNEPLAQRPPSATPTSMS